MRAHGVCTCFIPVPNPFFPERCLICGGRIPDTESVKES